MVTFEEMLKWKGCEVSPYCVEVVQKHGKIWNRDILPCLGCQNKRILKMYDTTPEEIQKRFLEGFQKFIDFLERK